MAALVAERRGTGDAELVRITGAGGRGVWDVADFVAIVESMGIRVNSLIKTNPQANKFVSG